MTYSYEVSEKLSRDLEKIRKKNKTLFERIIKKMQEILENPTRYKPLKRDLTGLKRVHIAKSFVLIFEVF